MKDALSVNRNGPDEIVGVPGGWLSGWAFGTVVVVCLVLVDALAEPDARRV